MSSDTELPEPDRIDGAPHPRETTALFGQDRAEADFLDAYASGRLHSGWMLTGPRGVGKATMAYRIARFLLTETPQDHEGGLFGGAPASPVSLSVTPDHPDARLVLSGAHPRLFILRRGPNSTGTGLSDVITVDPVRRLKEFFHMSAADGGRRVVILDAADELNKSAANAILKELEEPPARTTLLLVTHQPSRLLPTIRSRCRELRFAPLGPDDMALALAQAGIDVPETDALAALSGGSVGDEIRLVQLDGLRLYAELIEILGGLPRFDRPRAIKLADSCTGKSAATRFDLVIDLMDQFLARTARAGLVGAPDRQGAPGEARLLARLSPGPGAARAWADLAQEVSDRVRHGRAVNLDPASLILDTVSKIEDTARNVAAA